MLVGGRHDLEYLPKRTLPLSFCCELAPDPVLSVDAHPEPCGPKKEALPGACSVIAYQDPTPVPWNGGSRLVSGSNK